jgi:hypothetical protein
VALVCAGCHIAPRTDSGCAVCVRARVCGVGVRRRTPPLWGAQLIEGRIVPSYRLCEGFASGRCIRLLSSFCLDEILQGGLFLADEILQVPPRPRALPLPARGGGAAVLAAAPGSASRQQGRVTGPLPPSLSLSLARSHAQLRRARADACMRTQSWHDWCGTRSNAAPRGTASYHTRVALGCYPTRYLGKYGDPTKFQGPPRPRPEGAPACLASWLTLMMRRARHLLATAPQ